MNDNGNKNAGGWERLLELIPRLSLIVGGFSIVTSMLLVVFGVVGREVFNLSLPFCIEFSEYLIPTACYWGAAYTLSKNGHVNADVVVHRLPPRVREYLVFFGYLMGLPYLLVITGQLFEVTVNSYQGDYVSMYPLQTPLWLPQLLVWVGLLFFLLQLVVELIRKGLDLFGKNKQRTA